MPLAQKKSIYLIVSGRVQGVGFRYFALRKAEELNITGFVRNTPAGKVEIEATGESENLSLYTDWIKLGPARSVIKTISVSDITPIRTVTNFTIR